VSMVAEGSLALVTGKFARRAGNTVWLLVLAAHSHVTARQNLGT
jgi:hypothetical protein